MWYCVRHADNAVYSHTNVRHIVNVAIRAYSWHDIVLGVHGMMQQNSKPATRICNIACAKSYNEKQQSMYTGLVRMLVANRETTIYSRGGSKVANSPLLMKVQ